MNSLRTCLAIFLSSSVLLGCSKSQPTSFPALDEVLNPTETTLEQRSVDWFADQKEIRNEVLAVCFDYFSEKALTLGGQYANEFADNAYSKYEELPDCLNARKGEIQKMDGDAFVYEHQIQSIEDTLTTPEAQEHINKMAEQVAQHLDEMDERNKDINEEGKKLIGVASN